MLAAIQAPVIMMSQNRQDAKDRVRSELDYQVNLKAELGVAQLHEKFDRLEQRLLAEPAAAPVRGRRRSRVNAGPGAGVLSRGGRREPGRREIGRSIGATAGRLDDEGVSAGAGDRAGGCADESDDARLVRAAREGDRAAFGRLYERHARMVHGILLARAPRARRGRPRARGVPAGDAAARLAARRRRRSRPGSPRSPATARATTSAGPRTTVELKDDVAGAPHPEGEAMTVLAAIRRLPEAYRETLVLRLVEGLTGPEIAERTGLQPGSVRVNLHRGMQMLREALGGGGRETP